jgi:hypothetical protein
MRFPEIRNMVDARLPQGLNPTEVKEIVSKVTGGDDKISKTEQKQLEKVATLYADNFTAEGRKTFENLTGIKVPVKPGNTGDTVPGTVRPYETRVRPRDHVFAIVAPPTDNGRVPVEPDDGPIIGIVASPRTRPGGRVFGIVGPSTGGGRVFGIVADPPSRPGGRVIGIVAPSGGRGRGRIFGIA